MVELRWSVPVKASVEDVWALMRDTDAFNRRAGLGLRFHADDGVVRGASTLAGVTTTWTEQAFEWTAPTGFRSLRSFDGGPVATTEAVCAVGEAESGARIDYAVRFAPRQRWLQPVVQGLVAVALKPKFERAIAAVERALRGVEPWDAPPALSRAGEEALERGLAEVPGPIAHAIRRRVTQSPVWAQHALSPLQVAAQDRLPPREVVEGFLAAARGGALTMAWRVACPRCRRNTPTAEPLGVAAVRAHCEVCGVRFDGSVADNIEAVFAVAPAVRPEPPPVDCLLSPARTPHVLAQLRVAAGGEVTLPLRLEAGGYRVEVEEQGARGPSGSAWLEVSSAHEVEEAVVVVGAVVAPRQLALRVGTSAVRVRNATGRPIDVAVVRRWRSPHRLTAARLLGWLGEAALPDVLKAPGLAVRPRQGWVLVAHGDAELLNDAEGLLRAESLDRPLPKLLVAFDPEPGPILRSAELLVQGGAPLGIGLASGPVVSLTEGEGTRLAGAAVDDATAQLERVGRPRVAVAAADAAGLEAALGEARGRVDFVPRDGRSLLVFSSLLEPPILGWSSTRPRSTETPARVGPYTVLRELDRGGMGMVLDAATDDGQRVAIKIVLPDYASSDRLTQRFFNEAWYAAQVVHPNVVRVLDYGLHDDRPWLAMELLSGDSLAKHLSHFKKLSVASATPLLRGLLDALGALHAAGLVHRDLKPQNAMVLRDASAAPGGIKLLDFGLVRRAGMNPDEGLVGTPTYMAPEQLVGDRIDPAADVFAWGVLAHQVVLGRLPFAGNAADRVLSRMTLDVASLEGLEALGPLEAAVRAALSPLGERPVDARALAALLG